MAEMFFMSFVSLSLFLFTTINIGIAVDRATLRLELDWLGLCFAVAMGFLAVGTIGLVVWVTPIGMRKIAIALLIASNLAALAVHWRKGLPAVRRGGLIGLATWVGSCFALLILAQWPIPERRALPDGAYVYKAWTLPVRIQVMTGDLPPDNALPAFVAEYMARRVPFADVRPIMPAEEISNRPVLQSLIFLPFRIFLSDANDRPDPYPTFSYVGSTWPDTSVLIDDAVFADFLAVAIACDAALVLALGGMLQLFVVPHGAAALIVFGPLSPYFVMHSIFTWPKNLAGFFLVTAALLLERRVSPLWAALCVGLAYWSHPYAIAFVVCLAVVLAVEALSGLVGRRVPVFLSTGSSPGGAALALVILGAVVAPWYVWTIGVLHIHSDLLAQNFGFGTSLGHMIWARLAIFTGLIFPTALALDFDAHRLTRFYPAHLAAAVGLVPLLFIPVAFLRHGRRHAPALLWLGLIPGLMVVGAFGHVGMVPMFHGWQAVWPAMLAAALAVLGQEGGTRAVAFAILLQAGVNLALFGLRVAEFV